MGNICERLVIFTRYPVPGRTKTRLIPALGPEGASEVQRRMTEQTVDVARQISRQRDVALELRFEGGELALVREWIAPDLQCRSQGDGDLGSRLARAFDDAFCKGMERVIAIGCDCPGITPLLLMQTLDKLKTHDLVLGPANDGGYYLLGLCERKPRLFTDMPWGTAEVLNITLARAKEQGLSFFLLEPLSDVDRPEDLLHLNCYSNTR